MSSSKVVMAAGDEKRVSDLLKLKRPFPTLSSERETRKALSCDECGKGFSNPKTLTLHMSVHTGATRHKCKACGKKFSQVTHLRDHLKIHTGEKNFSCEYCEKTFNHKNHLTIHTMTHTGEKPFKCALCGKGFTRQSRVRDHLRVHSGEQPYECEICKRKFANSSNFKLHKLQHLEGDKPNKCLACGKSYTLGRYLQVHMEKEHPNVQPKLESGKGKGTKGKSVKQKTKK